MQPNLAESSLVHGRLGAGQMAGSHIHPMANRPFLLILLEDLFLLATLFAFKVDRVLCEPYRWSKGDYCTMKHAQPICGFHIAHQATLFIGMACCCGEEGSFQQEEKYYETIGGRRRLCLSKRLNNYIRHLPSATFKNTFSCVSRQLQTILILRISFRNPKLQCPQSSRAEPQQV